MIEKYISSRTGNVIKLGEFLCVSWRLGELVAKKHSHEGKKTRSSTKKKVIINPKLNSIARTGQNRE